MDDEMIIRTPCSGLTELFFPIIKRRKGQIKNVEEIDQAKRLCVDCFHSQECARDAVERKEMHGIWAGVNFSDEVERRKFMKEWTVANVSTV